MPPRKTILCVESDLASYELVRYMAELEGMDCDQADSGVKALDMLSRREYAAVVLAVFVPEMDGFKLCRLIREFYAEMPVVFYSGAVRDSERRKGLDAGADAYLIKPNDFDLLFETLSSISVDASRQTIAA